MDYMLDVIISKKDLNTAGLIEVCKEWGGKKYYSSPAEFVTDSGINFVEVEDISYYKEVLGTRVGKDLIPLHLTSGIFHDLEYSVNTGSENLKENDLLVFLKNLSRLTVFYILFVREDEAIKEKYSVTTANEIESIVLKSINWTNPKDVMIYKKM